MANTVVKMPQLGESVVEGTIGRWLKSPGDRVERDEPLVEIQTDKVNAEVTSPVAGILQQILLPEGATAAVTTDMAIIGDELSVAELSVADEPAAPLATPPATFSYDKTAGGGVVGTRDEDDAPRQDGGAETGAKRFFTPVVLRMAEEHALDLNAIQGSGAHGRVTRKDVERAIAEALTGPAPAAPPTAAPLTAPPSSGPALAPTSVAPPIDTTSEGSPHATTSAGPPTASPTAAPPTGLPSAGSPLPTTSAGSAVTPPSAGPGAATTSAGPAAATTSAGPGAATTSAGPGAATTSAGPPSGPVSARPLAVTSGGGSPTDEDRALTPMRRAIAEHMVRARTEIPDAWSLVEIDVTNLVRHRALQQADWQAREGYELTYLPFFIKAVVAGLRAVPELNATWAGDHITLHRQYDLGIAVSLENGLVVPVLRDADQLSIAGIARALRSIVLKARGGKLSLDDLQGGRFTVNNPGSLGSIMSQPIVPVGQAGIVTMEAIVKRPVVLADDAIGVRSMMNSCLSFDHRVLDGGGALRFLREIKRQIETVEYPVY